ncbi:MAG TPA: 16S rRNA (guanine(966)-N(2))-methyltransferase RsmD [Candidatus Paenibacillus intestinavium]|nr:16S rRNA (guanine(966)-N(2))-methyltransferase RsmD [Candidatus Paenibacillus intestinavium]
MRVIAGKAKGRALQAVPGQGTRPTTDKVKEAIFSMIGPYFDGGKALDLFAGTGGLGIEAWSRGMQQVIFVDKEKVSVDIIRSNVELVGAVEAIEIYRNDAGRAMKALAKRNIQFDLIFLDPPYRIVDMDAWMLQMVEMGLVAEDATIVVEHDVKMQYPHQLNGFEQLRTNQYGDIAVTIYRHVATMNARE